MNILRGSILYSAISGIYSGLRSAYQYSTVYVIVKGLKTAYAESAIMAWLLSRNPERGILQHSYTYRLLQGLIKAIAKLSAYLSKYFRPSVHSSGAADLLKSAAAGISQNPLAFLGLLGFAFMLTNLIASVIIAKGFTYPGTVFRAAMLLVFLLMMRVNVEGKSLLNNSFIFRFIKYMVD